MPRLHKIIYGVAIAHLLMIALYASHFAEWSNPENPVISKVSTVGHYTGSNNIFSFFAPELSDQPYVVYTLKDTLQREKIVELRGKSPDFANRINNIYGYLTLPEARMIFSASLSRFLMDQNPSVNKVRVAMVVQQIPDMYEFRSGDRCQWRFWFHRDFQKDSSLVAKH